MKRGTDVTIPAKATGVNIQADTQSVRYTMDGTDPTSSSGMLFLTTTAPESFLIEDLKRLRFIAGAGGAGNLNFHFWAGRDI